MEKEIDQRKKAEQDLQAIQSDLEGRVVERTKELAEANTRLQSEINERKKIEVMLKSAAQQLIVRNRELDRSNKDLDEFANIASHDMKEPLRGIHNYSQFLLDDYAEKIDDEGKSKLKTLTRLSQHLENLIESLLLYSQVGRLDLAIAEADLNRVLERILESSRIFLEEQGAKVRVPRPLPTIKCDQTRVGEIFLNLIINAAKYNDKPEKSIEIGYESRPAAKAAPRAQGQGSGVEAEDEIVFYVRDDGIGIREKHLETIFGIFKRLHGRDKYGGGTGLGLSIVKKIVERHGGKVWVESTPGEGSTFHFTLGQTIYEPQLEANTAR
jgi:light-regulated signal transduction histidine kinase (bacteriophytochrome)